MSTVDAVICGIEVKGLRLMESRYDGFDIHHKQRFSQGAQIAYLNSSSLNDEQKKAILKSRINAEKVKSRSRSDLAL